MNTTDLETEYPETKFFTFEDKLCAYVHGRLVEVATVLEGQEPWNLLKVAAARATAMPDLVAALKLLMHGAKQAQAAGLNQPQVNGGLVLAAAALAKASA